ncbi:MAG: hypothetical protein IJY92_05355 [Alphaproteobacteria bacterium]|nr:hypothetical protein [Alphaproteobacteria bacterium]
MLSPYEQITNSLKSGKITGSWLITGPFGVGKKTFAKRLSAFLTTGNWDAKMDFNPNVKWIECSLTEEAKKEIQKLILAGKEVEENTKTLARKKEITVDDIREGVKFLSLKSSSNEYRILVISLAEDMNTNAANALLKMLEEPFPRSIILLLSQNTGKLLPTIASRCRKIQIPRLSFDSMVEELKKLLPQSPHVELLAELSDGSIGLALKIHENDGLKIYQKMNACFLPLSRMDIQALNDFADSVHKNEDAFSLFQIFLTNWFSKTIKEKYETDPILSENLLNLYETTTNLFSNVSNIYLDRRQAIINTFLSIGEILNDR